MTRDIGDGPPSSSELQLEEICRALSSPERIYVLSILDNQGDMLSVSELVEQLRDETEVSIGEPADPGQAIELVLYHNHLPALAEAGILQVDWDRDHIELQANLAPIASVLKYARENR